MIVVAIGLLFYYSRLTFDLTPWAQAVMSAVTTVGYSDDKRYAQTTVLLFTDEDLRIGGDQYPVPYDAHRLVLSELDRDTVRPRALFIDFAFMHPDRESEAFVRLHEQVCALSKRTAVFVIDTRAFDKAKDGVPLFAPCAKPVDAYVNAEEPGGGLMSYPICGLPSQPVTDARCDGQYSAAVAMWEATRRPDAPSFADERRGERMALVWPARTRSTALCSTEASLHALLHLIPEVYHEGAEALKRRCPYTRTLTVGQFLTASESSGPNVPDLLANRVVFYGAKFALGGDFINTPAYKDLPGVYYHAMAYDNLVSFDGAPIREPSHAARLVIAALLALGAFALTARVGHAAPHEKPAGEALRAYGGVVIALGVLALVVVLFTWFGLHMGSIPEYLVLGCFAFYLAVRFFADHQAGSIALACFLFALGAYWFASISIDAFFAMILFFEVVHLITHHLGEAAKNVRGLSFSALPAHSWFRRTALVVLWPFKPD